MRKIYLVRHCDAMGQDKEDRLTKQGFKQAEKLKELFKDKQIDKIVSSDFKIF